MSMGPSASTRIPLGTSSLEVAPLGWGMWRFAGADRGQARNLVETALEIGCTLFDTADVYGYRGAVGFGAAETLLGEVFREVPSVRDRMVLATKAGVTPPVPYNSARQYLLDACDASLRRLHVEYVDLFQIHRPDLLTHPSEVARALDHLRQEGKIRAAGVSNYTATQIDALCEYLPFDLASVQSEFSPLAIDGLSDGVLDTAMRRGLAVLAWSPLGQGRLGQSLTVAPQSAPVQAVCAALDIVAARAKTTRSAVAYAWVLAHPARPVALIGSQNVARIREAHAAYAVHITREEWYRILVAARGTPMP